MRKEDLIKSISDSERLITYYEQEEDRYKEKARLERQKKKSF